MDDYLESCPTFEEVTRKSQLLVKLLNLGGFSFTYFVSNVPTLLPKLNQDPNLTVGDPKSFTADKALHVFGVNWNYRQDTLVVSLEMNHQMDRKITQWVVLTLVSTVYVPIGLVESYTINTRLLVKGICRLSGQQWDDVLPKRIENQFREETEELSSLSKLSLS